MTKYRFDQIARECRETYSGNYKDIPIVGLEHIIPNEMLLSDCDKNVETTFTKSFKKGQILFGRRRAYQRKACVATFDGICSGDITVIEAVEGIVSAKLLPFIIQSDDFFEHAIKGSNGALSPRVKWEHMSNFEIELPSISEQELLADKLWAAYELKRSYQDMIKATDEMVKSQFIEMFKEAPRKNLGDLASFINGSAFKPEEWSLSGLPIVRIQNLTQEDAPFNYYEGDSYSKIKITNGDVLVSWSATLGVYIWDKGDALLNQHIFKVAFDKEDIDKDFFIYTVKVALESMSLFAHGSTMRHVVKKDFDETQVAFPSKTDQVSFSNIVKQADKSKFELKKAIEAIDKVIKSLINENL